MSPEDLTDGEIRLLLESPKRVTHRPKRPKAKPGHDEWEWGLETTDGTYRFALYARQLHDDPDDFSCGLRLLLPSGDEVTLARCNGPAHLHRNPIERTRIEFQPHRHLATERYIRAGRAADQYAEACEDYDTLATALQALARECRVDEAIVLPCRPVEPELGL